MTQTYSGPAAGGCNGAEEEKTMPGPGTSVPPQAPEVRTMAEVDAEYAALKEAVRNASALDDIARTVAAAAHFLGRWLHGEQASDTALAEEMAEEIWGESNALGSLGVEHVAAEAIAAGRRAPFIVYDGQGKEAPTAAEYERHRDDIDRAKRRRERRIRDEVEAEIMAEKYPHAAAMAERRPVSALESRRRFLASRGQRRFLIEGVIQEGAYGALGARDKAGKSFLLVDAAVNLAGGGKWLGKYPCQLGRVLVHWTEGGEDEWNDRFEAVCRFYGLDPDAVAQNIEVQFHASTLTDANAMERLHADVSRFRPHLVLLDTFHSAAGEANGQVLSEMYAALTNLSGITQSLGAALLVFTHHKKSADGKGGTGDWSGVGLAEWARYRINVTGKAWDADDNDPTGKTRAQLALSFSGQISGKCDVYREVWREDRNDLATPMHYRIELGDKTNEHGRPEMTAEERRQFDKDRRKEWVMYRVLDFIHSKGATGPTERMIVKGSLGTNSGTDSSRKDELQIAVNSGWVEWSGATAPALVGGKVVHDDLDPDKPKGHARLVLTTLGQQKRRDLERYLTSADPLARGVNPYC
ncbi:AAA family ATPase [Amycolatopsis thermoflava]|uniref:AAA family ATPase n=1 Tax=Amycolatopsis thermoflava TaxID=84480 RepID=UPI003652975F